MLIFLFLFLLFLFAFLSIIFIVYLIRYYDLKECFLWILSKKQNIKHIKYIKKIKDIDEITKILQLTTKGKFIEYHIATPAWYPIISLESCDNELWKEVKQNFIFFINEWNKLNKENENKNKKTNYLSMHVEYYIRELINQNKIIDSIHISKITVKSICKYLFDYSLNEFEIDCLYKSSVEWKKEIALKGKGDLAIKKKAIEIIIKIIRKNPKIYEIFKEKWEDPRYYSVIMQPFIISPMINIPDILCNVQLLLKNKKINIMDEINYTFIDRIIYSYHPFPILERYDIKTDTQYFIPYDSLLTFDNYDKKTNILVFGNGARKCAGAHHAYQIIQPFIELYFEDIRNNRNLFNPIKNHIYSGRINDGVFNITELMYMCYCICNICNILLFSK